MKDVIRGSYEGPPLGDNATILTQIGLGLQHLHENETLYRDLKPNNIMISVPDGKSGPRIKLSLNFGITRNPAQSSLIKIAGTSGWVAPEFYTADQFTTEMDVFAFGLTIGYTLSNGRHLFGEEKEVRILRIKNKKSIALTPDDLNLSTSDVGVFELIIAMVNPELNLRPTLAQVLQHPFFNVRAPAPVHNLSTEYQTYHAADSTRGIYFLSKYCFI